MSDTEGSLPASGAHDLRNLGAEPEAARLPPGAGPRPEGGQIPPSAPGGVPLSGGPATTPATERTEPPEGATASLLLSQEERIAAATLAGGLPALPPGFGDTGGDWMTVRSENPFEVLYLDHRQAHRIQPEIVSRHRELLQNFWREKLKSLSQGAARVAILKKYGGEHEAEALVRSYPGRIEDAYHRLSTFGGIKEEYRKIVTRQQKAFFARLDEKLTDFLVDSVLQPQEIAALFEFADREDVAREIVAARVQERIRAAGLVSDLVVSGTTLEQQLLSSSWVHPSRKVDPLPIPVPKTNGMTPLLLFSLVVVLGLLIGAALVAYRMRSTSPTDSGNPPLPSTDPPVQIADLPQASDLVESAVPEEPRPATSEPIEEPAAPAAEFEKAAPPLRTAAAPPIEEPPAVSGEDRRVAQQELDDIRALSAIDPDTALERLSRLDSTLREHPQEFTEERVELANLRAQIQTAVMEGRLAEESRIRQEEAAKIEGERTQKWEKSLAQIESFIKQGNYSGAKNLADELLNEPDVPEPIATRARDLAAQAVAKLQEVFSKTKVKSKTNRSPDPPR